MYVRHIMCEGLSWWHVHMFVCGKNPHRTRKLSAETPIFRFAKEQWGRFSIKRKNCMYNAANGSFFQTKNHLTNKKSTKKNHRKIVNYKILN